MSDETIQSSGRTTVRAAEAVVVEREAPPDGFAAQLGRAARDNPAAAALIAIGATWLFAGGGNVTILGAYKDRGARRAMGGFYGRPVGAARIDAEPVEWGGAVRDGARPGAADLERGAHGARERASHAGREAAGLASDLGEELGDAARAGAERVSASARAASEAAARAGSAVARRSREAGRSAWRETEDVGRTVRELLEEQPLAVGALGLAAGVGLAFALPRTRAEAELLGERSDALKDRARVAMTGGIDEARVRADEALQRVVRDAEARGFSQDAIAGAIQEFTGKLEKVVLAASDAAEEEVDEAAKRA